MKFVKDCADLNALLKEVTHREIQAAEVGGRELRLVMSRKTADAFSVDRRSLPCGVLVAQAIEQTRFVSYYINGYPVDYNDGLPFGEVLFTEVLP